MANRHRGEYSFTAGENTYTLRFSHQALICLEEKFDKSLMQIIREWEAWSRDPEFMRIGMVRDMLWAGLQSHHPGLTLEQAAEILDDLDEHVAGAVVIIGEAFTRAFSAPGTKGTNPPQPKAVNGTGTTSGSSGSASDKTQTGSGSSRHESTN